MRALLLAAFGAALGLAPVGLQAQASPDARGQSRGDASQRGATPGIEAGSADSRKGGRNDREAGAAGAAGNAEARRNAKARGPEASGSGQRPAKKTGRRAVEAGPAAKPSDRTYGRDHATHGSAGGVAAGPENAGGAEQQGTAGKTGVPQAKP